MAGLEEYAALSFTPQGQQALSLADMVLSYDHDHGQRLAAFEYLKRDGEELEPMGANGSRLTYKIVIMGEAPLTAGGPPMSAGARYQALVRAQRSQPRGLLVDLRLGRWQVGWRSIRASEEPEQAIDCIEATLEFTEDQVDQALAIEAQPTPQARANEAINAYSILVAASQLVYKASPSALMQSAHDTAERFADTAAAFVNAALTAANTPTVDPTLRTQLENIDRQREAYFAALDDTLAFTQQSAVSLVPFRHGAYITYAASVELLLAVENLKPQAFEFVTPTQMTLLQVLTTVYGSDAQSHRQVAEALNPFAPRIQIPAGYRLRLITPTVRQ